MVDARDVPVMAWSGDYAELGAMTNFSFLEGASHPGEIMFQAKSLGLAAVGVADRNTLAGMVRALMGSEDADIPLVVGCRLGFLDGSELIVFPRDRAAYGRLCRLLTLGKSEILSDPTAPTTNVVALRPDTPSATDTPERITKGETRLTFDQAVAHGEGMIALAVAPIDPDAAFEARLKTWREAWPDTLYLAAQPLWRGDDRARLNRLAAMAIRTAAPMIATNAVMYHHPDRRPLQDVLTCIREGTTIDAAGLRLQANAERFLKPTQEMARLFKGHEAALERTMEVVRACRFSLRELSYDYPDEPVPPGWSPQRWLIRLTCLGAREKWPRARGPVSTHVVRTIRKELRLVRQLKYAPYFLTVHDIVAWARDPERDILCQGRGSAANSVICFCLKITNVDPTSQNMLIERFISADRSEPPDIDVDFEHERREEVMQYVYRRYGRDRAGIVATIIHYRPRSAIRDVGKALGLTEDVTARLADTVWGSYGSEVKDRDVDRAGFRRDDPRFQMALDLTAELIKFPRHLSQHVGGYVLSQGPLCEIVPIGNAAMADRTFIEWDKDDIDHLKLMKVDVLALGMLTALKRAFDMIAVDYRRPLDLHSVPRERGKVYRMLCKGDSLGVFQVESRAQMAMLPRLRPEVFYDLVVQVAIVRPGPIQGDMVHPYLKRRAERRAAKAAGVPFVIDYPRPAPEHGPPDELKLVLDKTLGVPLFQEQAMKIAMDAATFSPSEANGLRRAMATFRHMGTIGHYETIFVGRMIARGYDPTFAQRCFDQIKGFGEYGFPESHACSFAHLVYLSAWVKCLYPEVFAACLLNSQPMGFYAPAQIVRDAVEHGVEVRHPDVNASDWDCSLERRRKGRRRALRLGLRSIDGFRRDWAERIMLVRAEAPFNDLEDLRLRAKLPPAALDRLAEADAFGSLKLSRRQGMWAAKGAPPASSAPLFEAMGLDEADGRPPEALPKLTAGEEVVGDYQTIRLSLKGHPVAFLRERLAQAGAMTALDYQAARENRRVAVGGVVLVRQRPGSAKGVVFLTLEDETGVANLVVWPDVFERLRPIAMGARMILARGRVQRAEGVTHLVVEDLIDWTPMLGQLSMSQTPGSGHAPSGAGTGTGTGRGRHPRDVRILPGSRDFH
ncbi:Error-prone DNA polymerase [Brevundimonas sp. NIBR10]|uniref:error-prone DNA polymerase n=1 Tax=Brevundimonas sp. NIBR10 TaxID=3015997 RepID=UPI0022F1A1E2|nr:error-prone DNA polymerase [Brevundimonas sp. NIBR10]WGM48842.1 Error-prone DNA polymerase [Brevundimonas sp. NIBR10]